MFSNATCAVSLLDGLMHRVEAAVRAIDLGHHTFHRDIGLVHRASRSLGEPARLLAQFICRAYSASAAPEQVDVR